MQILSFIGILLAVAAFMYLGYKGYNIIFLGLAASIVVMVFGRLPIIETLTETYMGGFVGYAKKQYLMFLLGAVFARLMSNSGAAAKIGLTLSGVFRKAKTRKMQRVLAILSLPAMNMIFTYGGVSSMLAVFIMVPIAKNMFEELDIPWKLYGFASFGVATVTSGFLPGSPQATNVTPIAYLGTDAMAGATLGIICSILAIVMAIAFCFFEVNRFEKSEEGFLPSGEMINKEIIKLPEAPDFNVFLALVPPVVLLVVLNVLKQNVVTALAAGCLMVVILFWKHLDIKTSLAQGVPNGVITVTAICAAVGFGSTVAATPGYQFVLDMLDRVPGSPAYQIWVAVNMCSFVCGSSQSGVGVALQTMGERFMASGIPAPAIHRLCSISACGLDTMPHSIGVINSCAQCKLTHQQIYYYFFVLTVIIPFICGLFCATLITLGIGV